MGVLLSGDVWLLLWTWPAAVLARPSVPAGAASKNGHAEIKLAGLAAPMAQTSAQLHLSTERGGTHAHEGRDESGWCSDMTSTHGAWRHAGA